jgi:acyl carrier protein
VIAQNERVAEAVFEALSPHLQKNGADELRAATTFAEIDVDSLGIAGTLADVERILGFQLAPDELVWCYEVNTIGEFVAAIDRAWSLRR